MEEKENKQEVKLRKVICSLIYHGRRFYNSQHEDVDNVVIKKSVMQIKNIFKKTNGV